MHFFICEDNLDSILTGIYDAWNFKIKQKLSSHKDIHLTTKEPDNYQLFSEYYPVTTNSEKSEKVSHTLRQKLGIDFFESIVNAAMAQEPPKRNTMDKADAIYQTVVFALNSPAGAKVLNYLGVPFIQRVFELSRATGREAHHLSGFLRFLELENGVLFAKIHPKNNALPYLAEHFTDRLPLENFIIYDENRQIAAVHRTGKDFMLVDASDLNQEVINRLSEKELEYQKLWLTFFDNIAITARINPKLQAQNIPKRYWKDTVELKDKVN